MRPERGSDSPPPSILPATPPAKDYELLRENIGDGTHLSVLPAEGYVRLRQIIGDSKADPPVPGVLPIKASTFWAAVAAGRIPRPVKFGRASLWRVEDIRAVLASLSTDRAA